MGLTGFVYKAGAINFINDFSKIDLKTVETQIALENKKIKIILTGETFSLGNTIFGNDMG